MLKDIIGYEGLYKVDSSGYVINKDGHKLHPWHNNHGYVIVDLSKNGVRKHELLHRLVALAFVNNPNPDDWDIVNHIDANKEHNSFDNLEWCDTKYNVRDIQKRGKLDTETARRALKKVQQVPVIKMDLDGNFLAEYPSYKIAAEASGINHPSHIGRCIHDDIRDKSKGNKPHTAGGYRWRLKYDNYKSSKQVSLKVIDSDNTKYIFKSIRQAERYFGLGAGVLSRQVKLGNKKYKGYSLVY